MLSDSSDTIIDVAHYGIDRCADILEFTVLASESMSLENLLRKMGRYCCGHPLSNG